MTLSSPRTAFLGLSHLGIVSSLGWASHGQPVVAIDSDDALVSGLERGELPIYEPGLEDLSRRAQPCIQFSTRFNLVADCPLVIVARDVPTDDSGVGDTQVLLDLIDQAMPHLQADVVLVIMSQIPPGFTRALVERIQTARPDLAFSTYHWVETLVFGDAVRRCLEPERFIIGCAVTDSPLAPVFQRGLEYFGCPVVRMSYESAELVKAAINLYLIGSVTYANALADLCEGVGADWAEMMPALRLDRRIGPAAYLRPSLGIGGGNLERDLATLRRLSQGLATDATYLDALAVSNAQRFDWVHRRLAQYVFASTPQPRLGIWGLTYKRDTHSTRNSPALRLIGELAGRARVVAWDPVVSDSHAVEPAVLAASRDAVLDGADALLVMTDWPHFAEADFGALARRMRHAVVVDCVGILEHQQAAGHGVTYVSMGSAG